MGTFKNVDDISFKNSEETHTLKATEDATIKSLEDIHTLKTVEDATVKSLEDIHTLKAAEDTYIETLQEGHGGTINETLVEGGYTAVEGIYNLPGGGISNPGVMTAQPFVLANPHHTMAWTQTFGDPNDPKLRTQQYENHISQIEAAKNQLSEQLKQLDQYHESVKRELEDIKQSQKKEE